MSSEIHVIEQHNKWSLTHLPQGKQCIDCQWIYKVIFQAAGFVERYKVRLIDKECRQ